MNKIKFKDFILNENHMYLSEKIGDVLSAVADFSESKSGMRQTIRFFEKIVALIRRILHSNWPQTEYKHLRTLQKIGVSIMKGIEEKQDLRELMPSIKQELEQLSTRLGTPINDMGPESENAPSLENPQQEAPPKPPQDAQPQGQPPSMPPQGTPPAQPQAI